MRATIRKFIQSAIRIAPAAMLCVGIVTAGVFAGPAPARAEAPPGGRFVESNADNTRLVAVVGDRDLILAAPDGVCFNPAAYREDPFGFRLSAGDCALMGTPDGRRQAALEQPAFALIIRDAPLRDPLQGAAAAARLEEMGADLLKQVGASRKQDGRTVTMAAADITDGAIWTLMKTDGLGPDNARVGWTAVLLPAGVEVTVARTAPANLVEADDGRAAVASFVRAILAANAD